MTDFLAALDREFPAGFYTQAPSELEAYGKDWTKVYTPKPSLVAFPTSTEQVSRFLCLANESGVAVVPSGGRTGLAGGAVAAKGEAVLSLIRMNRLGTVDPLSHTLWVEAGAVTQAVHEHCAPQGLTWPVDFASKGSSQVGGNIATNAGGVRVIRYGLTRQWVLGLKVALMNGEVLDLNGALEKNNTGLDLRQMFIGTEGTLGVICEATLKLARLPQKVSVFFFSVDSIQAVLALFENARKGPFDIAAFECLSDACMRNVCEVRGLSSPFPAASPYYVLMEVETPESDGKAAALESWLERAFSEAWVKDGTLAQSPREARDLWALREGISESLSAKGMVHKHDIALPISRLEAFLAEWTETFERTYRGYRVFTFGHIGDGNLHINIMKPESLDKIRFLEDCDQIDDGLFAIVQKHRGSVSAEHGIGLLKKRALHFSRAPEELALLRGMKRVFDPKHLLNPGKIFD